MRFRNVKTGVVIDAPSMLGGPWERIDGGKAPAKEPAVDVPVAKAEDVKPVKKTIRKTTTKKTK
jgi:hypothetical protein